MSLFADKPAATHRLVGLLGARGLSRPGRCIGSLVMGRKTYQQLLEWGWLCGDSPTFVLTSATHLAVPDGANVTFRISPHRKSDCREVSADPETTLGVWRGKCCDGRPARRCSKHPRLHDHTRSPRRKNSALQRAVSKSNANHPFRTVRQRCCPARPRHNNCADLLAGGAIEFLRL